MVHMGAVGIDCDRLAPVVNFIFNFRLSGDLTQSLVAVVELLLELILSRAELEDGAVENAEQGGENRRCRRERETGFAEGVAKIGRATEGAHV